MYNGVLFSHQKGNPVICDNVGRTCRHYAEGNNQNTERDTTSSHLYMESKIIKITEAESRILVARERGQEENEETVKRYKHSVIQNEGVLESSCPVWES